MIRLPDYDHDALIVEEGWIYRALYDAEGNEVYRIKGDFVGLQLGVNRQANPTAYHREYYRKVRSKRDGRTPRGPYKK